MTIKELRLEKGLTRADFAERLGIALSTLDDYESGKRTPGAKELDAIKAICGTELSIPAPAEATGPESTVAVEPETGETAEEAVAEEEGAEEPDAGEADEKAVAVEEDTEEPNAGEADDEAVAGEEGAEEADAGEADEEAVAEEEDTGEAEASEEVDEEEAALIAALKEARKAEKKARKAEKLAARQKADEEATQRVIDIISLLSGSVGLKDRDAVAAARDAYDSLTDDQELMIPGDVLRLLFSAEQRIEDTLDAAAREAAKYIPIEECEITVKDVTFNGKKIKKPSVKVVCGETALEPGEDYKLKYDKKISEIGLYTLTVKGKGRFTGSVRIPFYVVPKASEYARLLGCDKQAAKEWKLLKNIEGYQIEYSQSKDFSDGKKAKIREPKDLEKALRKLKPGKKYHLRVRLFARVKKKNHYSDWSKVGTVKM